MFNTPLLHEDIIAVILVGTLVPSQSCLASNDFLITHDFPMLWVFLASLMVCAVILLLALDRTIEHVTPHFTEVNDGDNLDADKTNKAI